MQNHSTHKGKHQGQKAATKQHARTSPQARTAANDRIQKGFGDVFRELASR